MTGRLPGLVAWSMALLAFAAAFACLPLIVLNRDQPIMNALGTAGGQVLGTVSITVISALGLAVARRGANPMGWIFLCGGLVFEVGQLASHYAIFALFTAPGSLPGGMFMFAAGHFLILVLVPAFLTFLVLLFPNGRPASRRWGPFVVAVGVVEVFFAITSPLRPGPFDPPWEFIENPYGLSGAAGDVVAALAPIATGMALTASLIATGAMVVRFRFARGIERQQLKLVAYSATLLLIYAVLYTVWSLRAGHDLGVLGTFPLGVLLVVSLPVSAGIAVLRYRLYDIDLVIKRTVVYGVTSAFVAGAFFAGIVALQQILRPFTSGNEIAVAVSTLVSFALFQPVRRRVQDEVDRRFDRSRYDAARAVDAFGDRVRDVVELDALRVELLGSVRRTLGPASISLWLRRTLP
jgi:hypothetical protein